jgi:hypothetical protein
VAEAGGKTSGAVEAVAGRNAVMVKSFDDRLWKLAVLKNALENL